MGKKKEEDGSWKTFLSFYSIGTRVPPPPNLIEFFSSLLDSICTFSILFLLFVQVNMKKRICTFIPWFVLALLVCSIVFLFSQFACFCVENWIEKQGKCNRAWLLVGEKTEVWLSRNRMGFFFFWILLAASLNHFYRNLISNSRLFSIQFTVSESWYCLDFFGIPVPLDLWL